MFFIFITVALAARLRLQPFGRLRDGPHDEGEALLRGIQHRAGTEACSGDHRIGGVLHGQFYVTLGGISRTVLTQACALKGC